MRRSTAIPTLALVTMLLAGACGDDDSALSDPPAEPATTSTTGTDDISYPTGEDELVVSVDRTYPALMIGGDGTVYRNTSSEATGLVRTAPAVAPPAPPSEYTVATINDQGMRIILGRAAELDLLTEEVNPESWNVMDETWTSLTIVTSSGTVEHSLPSSWNTADGPDEGFPRLNELIDDLEDIESLVRDDNISDASEYVPEQWLITKGYAESTDDAEPWPLDEPPVLDTCVALPTDQDTDTATGAYDGGTLVYARPAMPWDEC